MLFFLSVLGCVESIIRPTCGLPSGSFVPSRVVQGDVLWLPNLVGVCDEGGWAMDVGPSRNALEEGEGWSHITLDEIGLHQFASHGLAVDVEVISADEAPFHNLAYYPGRSLVQVGAQWWVAQAYSPELSVVEDGVLTHEIAVGPWPVALAAHPDGQSVLVVTRANDSIGVVSVEERRIVQSIHVGDEPAHVAIGPSGEWAYVSLNTEGAIAVVDLAQGEKVHSWPAVQGVSAFDLSADGTRLVALVHRSGRPERTPLVGDEPEDELDGVLMDATSGEILQEYKDIGGTNNSVLFSDDGDSFYFSTTLGDNGKGLTSGESFEHRVRRVDVSTGEILADVDLFRQETSGGTAVTPHQMSLLNDVIWIVAEGSGQLLKLDANTLEELGRAEASGLPRDVRATAEGVVVHSGGDYLLHRYDLDANPLESVSLGVDPRTAEEAQGQALFFQAGQQYASNYACNSCHADTRGDTQVWQAGPVDVYQVSRSLFWLEGTAPLGWSGYVNTVSNFGITGSASIGVQLNSDESEAVGAYLSSIMPPPAANHRTGYDGSLSVQARRVEALYNGKAGCVACHDGPVATNNLTVLPGVTYDQTSTPSLVGVYRHGVWFKHGEATTYRDAVEQVLQWLDNPELSQQERDDLLAYLESMTDRHFFVLSDGFGGRPDGVGIDRELSLTMNQPVWPESVMVSLETADGMPVDAEVRVEHRRIVITPSEWLLAEADYILRLEEARSFTGRVVSGDLEWGFTTAAVPTISLKGAYTWSVDVPSFNPTTGSFDESRSLPFPHRIEATPTASGAEFTVQYGEDTFSHFHAVVDGNKLITPPLPVSLGNSAADSTGMQSTLLDLDEDGVADVALGTTLLSGPGIWFENLYWQLESAIPPDACEPGLDGDFAIEVSEGEEGLQIEWEGPDALGVYVTDYPASLPVGPGQTVTNGVAYWAIQTDSFPVGFEGPVVYGQLPDGSKEASEENGAPVGGTVLVPGMCLKFSVIRDDFTISSRTLILE